MPAASISKARKSANPQESVPKAIDLRDVMPTEDTTAERLRQESSKVSSAFLGYAKIDFLEMSPSFGKWNFRKVVDSEVKKMVSSMMEEGIQRYVMKNLIPLAISKDTVDLESLVQSGGEGGDVFPLLQFKSEEEMPEVFAYGGQHRRAALERLRDQQIKELEADMLLFEKEKELMLDGKTEAGEVSERGERIVKKKGDLKALGMWGVAVYDLDKCLANKGEIGKLLSRNDALHRYGETTQEFFVNLIRDLVDTLDGSALDPETHRVFWDRAKQKQTSYGEVISTTPIVEMLMDLWPMKEYYTKTRFFFQPTVLRKNVIGHSAALIAWQVRKSVAVMRQCASRCPFKSYQDVDKLLREVLARSTSAERREELVNETEALLVDDDPDFSFWSTELLEAIDAAAEAHLSKAKMEIGMAEDEYLNSLGGYTQAVIEAMQKFCSGHLLLDQAMARFKWRMTKLPGQPIPMPLITEKVLDYMCASLGQIGNAIEEVARWFEPLYGYHTTSRGMSRWIDASCVLADSIKADPGLDVARRAKAVDAVFQIIWDARGTYIAELESLLLRHKDLLVREEKASQLEAFFNHTEELTVTETNNWKHVFLGMKTPDNLIDKLVQAMGESLVSKQPSKAHTYFGWRLIDSTHWPWKDLNSRSRKRDWTVIAKSAVVEEKRIIHYRRPIILKTPISHFRATLASTLSDFAAQRIIDGEATYQWSFRDYVLKRDVSKIPTLQKASFQSRVAKVQSQLKAAQHLAEINRTIRHIQGLGVATINGDPKGKIEKNVAIAVKHLANALTYNAQRLSFRTKNGTNKSFSIKDDVKLTKSWDIPLRQSQADPLYNFDIDWDHDWDKTVISDDENADGSDDSMDYERLDKDTSQLLLKHVPTDPKGKHPIAQKEVSKESSTPTKPAKPSTSITSVSAPETQDTAEISVPRPLSSSPLTSLPPSAEPSSPTPRPPSPTSRLLLPAPLPLAVPVRLQTATTTTSSASASAATASAKRHRDTHFGPAQKAKKQRSGIRLRKESTAPGQLEEGPIA